LIALIIIFLKILFLRDFIFEPSLKSISIWISFGKMPLNLIFNIRINQIINLVVELQLIFGDESHVKEPLFEVFVFATEGHKLIFADGAAFVVVVLFELVLVDFFDFFRLKSFVFECGVVHDADLGEVHELRFFEAFGTIIFGDNLEELRPQLTHSHVAQGMDCTNELILINATLLIKVHYLKELLSEFGGKLILINKLVAIEYQRRIFLFILSLLFPGHN
jgi:hypothetical protein